MHTRSRSAWGPLNVGSRMILAGVWLWVMGLRPDKERNCLFQYHHHHLCLVPIIHTYFCPSCTPHYSGWEPLNDGSRTQLSWTWASLLWVCGWSSLPCQGHTFHFYSRQSNTGWLLTWDCTRIYSTNLYQEVPTLRLEATFILSPTTIWKILFCPDHHRPFILWVGNRYGRLVGEAGNVLSRLSLALQSAIAHTPWFWRLHVLQFTTWLLN